MAARWPSRIFVSVPYLENRLRYYNDFQFVDVSLLDTGKVRFWSQSEIQNGRQVAIVSAPYLENRLRYYNYFWYAAVSL